jgi:MATE family multidrug resistance protein
MRSFVIAIISGLGLIMLQAPLLNGVLTLIGPSQQVSQLASEYYNIRIWGAPAVLMSYGLLGWFIGIQNTKALLMIQVGMNVCNIILDLVFVLGFGWGVQGVAFATVISETGAAIYGCWLALRYAKGLGGQWRLSLLTQWDRLKKLMSLNRDIIIRTLCLEAAFLTITALGARMGDTILAVNAVLMLFQGLMAYGLDGFAHAVETLAGHAKGARDKTAFKAAVRTSTIWALGFSAPFSLAFWLFGGEIIDLMSTTAEVRLVARDYLVWIIILPVLSVWSFQLDGIFFGLTRGKEMRNAMIMSLLVFAAAISLLVEPFGNHGLWLAFSIFMVTRGITLGYYYPAIERSMDKIL